MISCWHFTSRQDTTKLCMQCNWDLREAHGQFCGCCQPSRMHSLNAFVPHNLILVHSEYCLHWVRDAIAIWSWTKNYQAISFTSLLRILRQRAFIHNPDNANEIHVTNTNLKNTWLRLSGLENTSYLCLTSVKKPNHQLRNSRGSFFHFSRYYLLPIELNCRREISEERRQRNRGLCLFRTRCSLNRWRIIIHDATSVSHNSATISGARFNSRVQLPVIVKNPFFTLYKLYIIYRERQNACLFAR